MAEEGHVSAIQSSMSDVELVLVGFLFVDYTDVVVLGKTNEEKTVAYSWFEMELHESVEVSLNLGGVIGILHVFYSIIGSEDDQKRSTTYYYGYG